MQINRNVAIPAAVGVASLSLGFAAGYLFCKKQNRNETIKYINVDEVIDKNQLRMDFEALAEEQEVKQSHPSNRDYIHEEAPPTLVLVEETEEELIITFNDDPEEVRQVIEATEEERVSIFTNQEEDADWDYDREIADRTPDKPYIINVDEFFEDSEGHRQSVLTYYVGDEVLCDEANVPIYNPKRLVGELIFGHGSRDQNIVYIRNEELDAEYEIIRDPGHYQIEVLGGEIEADLNSEDLKHSLLKFRE